jgi:hypothetical protein
MPRFLFLSTGPLGLAFALASCGDTIKDDASRQPPGIPERAGLMEQPVQIGFDGPRFDACAGYGRISRLEQGEESLTVRSAPAAGAPEVDRLQMGVGISMCQQVGDWLGVVYDGAGGEEPVDCGTGSPVASVRNYDGPCRSGWVHEDFVKLVAG